MLGRLAAAHHARRRQVVRNVHRRIQQRDPVRLKLVRHRRQHGRVASVVPQPTVPDVDRAPIRQLAEQSQRIVHAGLGDPADHDGLAHAVPAQEADPPADLDDAGGLEAVAQRGQQLAVVLVAQADAAHPPAGRADPPGDDDGQHPLSGDQADGPAFRASTAISAWLAARLLVGCRHDCAPARRPRPPKRTLIFAGADNRSLPLAAPTRRPFVAGGAAWPDRCRRLTARDSCGASGRAPGRG
jgi:hypothetical protein